MPMVWNDQADAKLLMAIITKNDARMNWTGIAEYMGPECSVSAVQHRIQRLKEKAAKASGTGPTTNGAENDNDDGVSSAAPSPVKRKRRRPKKAAPANSADAGEEEGSPTKIQKGSKALAVSMEQGQDKVKMEGPENFA